ncbi:MAG: DUF5340 domain-containing protein [Cyanobacteria bacterium SID2]|nr:DUF5340 domain-containing protein [Cyanobacteria bacterium SID2]MBP0002214.1 DUF5340 domain-containing protein [Cyanobacteria bacterium SBC]
MEPLPLPSHIHYELLLQLLERQTLFAVAPNSKEREQINQLIITLRKALAQQKRLEEVCQLKNLPIDYRWSLNQPVFRSTMSTSGAPSLTNGTEDRSSS